MDGSRSRALQGGGNLQGWLAAMAKIEVQRMSAETKATRAVVYAIGVPVPEPDMNTREHERIVANRRPNASAIPRGVRGERGCGRCV